MWACALRGGAHVLEDDVCLCAVLDQDGIILKGPNDRLDIEEPLYCLCFRCVSDEGDYLECVRLRVPKDGLEDAPPDVSCRNGR